MSAAAHDVKRNLLIIITYNSYSQLPDILGTIREFLEDGSENYAAIIENSGDSRVQDFFEQNYASERLLVQIRQDNLGFSPGVNLAYDLSRSRWGAFDFVILLNPDVEFAGGTVCALADRAANRADPNAKVWGVILKDSAGNIDRGCARRVWNRRRFFSLLLGYDDLARVLNTKPRNLTPREIANDQSELAIVSGALMCIDTEILDAGLDTLLPMYLEDQEICMRCRKNSYTVTLFPDLEAVHAGGVSRKSATQHDRALRIMELVEAPVQCMVRMQSYSLLQLRAIVLIGGALRILAATIATPTKVATKRGNWSQSKKWMVEQQTLGLWFIIWAIRGKFHTEEISLASYFREYVKIG